MNSKMSWYNFLLPDTKAKLTWFSLSMTNLEEKSVLFGPSKGFLDTWEFVSYLFLCLLWLFVMNSPRITDLI